MRKTMMPVILGLLAMLSSVMAENPYQFLTWNVTYGTISPLGVPQQGILINGQFPGPNINCTGNDNIVVNVFNNLDEPFLLTWNGIQHRMRCWQDGVQGTNCPILPGQNFTYHFQPKDQIGSYFYFPTTAFHRAAGAFGGLRVNSRLLIPVPYADPEDDYTVLVGDWFNRPHKDLRNLLDSGRSLGLPDGIHINGKSAQPGQPTEPLFVMTPGKTYKYRILQNSYDSLDVHVGQCFAVLVTADQRVQDYYLVASSRFLKKEFSSVGRIRYGGSDGTTSPQIPAAPVGWLWSLNQFRSFRWNLTASAARPNPQGSYHYGRINITRTIKLISTSYRVNDKLRFGFNGISHVDPDTPVKMAEYFGVPERVFKYNIIQDNPSDEIQTLNLAPNVLNFTYRNFVEIIFENRERSMQSFHLDGYSFFAVAVEHGRWTPEKRKGYNLLDAVSRHTVQVFPKSWAAILLTFDNAGMWNLRSELWERRYLGQQLYASVVSPERSLRDELNPPENTLLCGIVKDLPKPAPYT